MRNKRFLIFSIIIFFLSLAGCEKWNPLRTKPTSSVNSIDGSIRCIDSTYFPHVKAYTRIIDQNGNPLVDFKIGNFNISENGKPGVICNIKKSQGPLFIALVLDRSGSMYWYENGKTTNGTTDLNNAVKEFFNNLDFSITSVGIIDFGTNVIISQEFTKDKDALITAIDNKEPESAGMGGTALYDAIAREIDEVNKVSGGEILLITMTDGTDTASLTYTRDSVISYANTHNQIVNTIAYGIDLNLYSLQLIASQTGGIFGHATTGDELAQLYLQFIPTEKDHIRINFRSRVSGSRKLTVYCTYGSLTDKFSKTYSP